jgi:AhpC/TSA family
MLRKRTVALFFVTLLLASGLAMGRLAWAIDVGDKAPDFTLPSTTGGNVSLSQFRGKKLVLIEFYGADFAPA